MDKEDFGATMGETNEEDTDAKVGKEDIMLKHMFERLQKRKSQQHLDHEKRIQQVDGGFFERFGSLLRQQTELAKEQEYQENIRVAEEAAQFIPIIEEKEVNIEPVIEISDRFAESDTDGETSVSSDSELDPEKTVARALGWNIDELYSEILYEILHNVGCDVSYEIGQTALFSYVQDAFKMTNEKHEHILTVAEQKEPPELLLNVEVIEAKDLAAKDSNGLTDPFITLYLASNTSHRYNTSVKTGTLQPVWEEHFALPVTDKSIEDILCLEVWDFDPAETVREKFSKLFQVKGVKGVKKLVKEIAVTATMGQHENELVGTARIPLRTVPAAGMTMWYSLDKKNKVARQGVVKVHLTFGSEKNCQVAAQEHRHLLRILLIHELESSKVSPYWWCANFSPQADILITQHAIQSGLSPVNVAFTQWAVYSAVHKDHPLSFALFSNLLDKLVKPIQTSAALEEDVKLFWDSVKKLLPSCFGIIRKIRKKSANEKNSVKQVLEVLKIIAKLSTLEPPPQTDLFPSQLYVWLSYKGREPNCDIQATLRDAITQGASDWFNHIIENNKNEDHTDEGKLQYLIKIIQLIRTDLQKAVEFYEKMFQEVVNCQYARTLYILYQTKISSLVETEVIAICKNLKKISYNWNLKSQDNSTESLNTGTKLFELYLALQRFVVLGEGLCPADCDDFHIQNFHKWFHGGVAQWLDIAVFKALQRIEKAVELDNLTPVDETVKYSSSALDTLTIFHQIKIFWEQLNWPDVEGSYTFIAKIIDDICRCSVFFADRMSMRVEGMGEIRDMYESRFEVTSEWCLAINNIDYVRQSLDPFADELEMEDILQKLSDLRSPLEAQRCRETLQNVIENSIDTVRNKIIELLETVATKMTPAMKRLLVEGAELLNQDSNSIDRVMMYLDNNLATLHADLNEDNFNRILEIIWDNLGAILKELIQSNIEKRRPPSFFANLHETLKLMVKSFKQSDETSDCDALRQIEHLLSIHGMETTQLIHEVHIERWRHQQSINETPFGTLTVRIKFDKLDLIVETINARNLIAMDSNGSSDSYVRINLLPEEKFTTTVKPKTQTHNKNLFPLYDETFVITLTHEQKNLKDGLLIFVVKDSDFLGMSNQLIGEAYVHFSEIPDTPKPISALQQTHLNLHRPTELSTGSVKALENRQDKLAKEFLKKYKQKMVNHNST